MTALPHCYSPNDALFIYFCGLVIGASIHWGLARMFAERRKERQ